MRTRSAYCSTFHRDVKIAIPDESADDGAARVPGPQLVCLDIGHQCTGGFCPLGQTDSAEMAVRLARHGLQTSKNALVTLACPACRVATTFVVIDELQAMCTDCGSMSDW